MTRHDLNECRKRLEAMVRRLTGEEANLRSELFSPAGRLAAEQHTEDDLSRERAEEEVALGLLENEEGLLSECRAALFRMETGGYGRCETCRKPISKGRLMTLPHTRLCIRCARTAQA